MKVFNKKNMKYALIIIFITINTLIISHGSHKHKKSNIEKFKENKEKKNSNAHGHKHIHQFQSGESNVFQQYVNHIFEFLEKKMENFTKEQQAYIGALIVSSASLPVFFIIIIFNIKSIKILDIMSAFAAGALVGDVFTHNLPEIYEDENRDKSNFFLQKETLLGLGLIFLFSLEKIVKLLVKFTKDKKVQDIIENHAHSHHSCGGNSENIILSIFGDLIHNVTDGLAIGAAFATNLKLGLTLTISIFFHEIPHEVGDFSFLLKQNLSKFKALSTQIISAIGAFLGVYLNFVIGDKYSLHILSFASGAFLYLAINTILGDIKEAKSFFSIIWEICAFMLGFYLLFIII